MNSSFRKEQNSDMPSIVSNSAIPFSLSWLTDHFFLVQVNASQFRGLRSEHHPEHLLFHFNSCVASSRFEVNFVALSFSASPSHSDG